MTLHMVQAEIDVRRAAARTARDHPRQRGQVYRDLGFVIKTALSEAFGGEAAPRPWHLQRTDGKGRAVVLGYADRDGAALREQLAFAEPELAGVVPAEHVHATALPALAAGQQLRASLTCHPTVHTAWNGGQRRERDRYLVEVDRAEREGRTPAARETVYADFIRERLAPAFRAEAVHLTGYAIPRLTRKHHGREGPRLTRVQLPVCHAELALTVTDAAAAERLLAQGVGRGKAYGCGMLRVRPA